MPQNRKSSEPLSVFTTIQSQGRGRWHVVEAIGIWRQSAPRANFGGVFAATLPCDGDLLNVVLKLAKPGKRIVGILSVSRICKKRWVDELRDIECNERLPLLNSIGHGFHGRRDLMPHFD